MSSIDIVSAVAEVSFVMCNFGIALGDGLNWCVFLTSAQEMTRQIHATKRIADLFITIGLFNDEMAGAAGFHKASEKIPLAPR